MCGVRALFCHQLAVGSLTIHSSLWASFLTCTKVISKVHYGPYTIMIVSAHHHPGFQTLHSSLLLLTFIFTLQLAHLSSTCLSIRPSIHPTISSSVNIYCVPVPEPVLPTSFFISLIWRFVVSDLLRVRKIDSEFIKNSV